VRRNAGLLLWLLALTGAFGFALGLDKNAAGDPDRYYHLALSRITVESHRPFLRSLPQVENLLWGDLFVDKEFLFHQLTTAAYRLAGERGVEEAVFLCAIAALAIFFLFAASRLPLLQAASATLLTFFNPYLAFRLSLLRPHVLALLAFVLANIFVLARRPRLTGLAAFVFVMSYHSFYLLAACFCWLVVVSFLEDPVEARGTRAIAWHGLFGSFCGLLANPYFPGNIEIAVNVARIPGLMKGELQGLNFGNELFPMPTDQFFAIFSGAFFLVVAGFFLLGRGFSQKEREPGRSQLPYLLGISSFFLLLSFQMIRAGEYLIPSCGLLCVLLLDRCRNWPRAAGGFALAAALAQLLFLANLLAERARLPENMRVRNTLDAVAAIPKDAVGAKIFNCEWDRTPYLLYARPDLRFLDILDPSLLYFADRNAFHGRDELRNGKVADALGMIRNAFRADFVLCEDINLVNQLRADPGFQQLYPAFAGQTQGVPALFRVSREKAPYYVRKLSLSKPARVEAAKLAGLRPERARGAGKVIELGQSSYLNLAAEVPVKNRNGADFLCSFVSPTASETARLAGARYLGVGGGQGFEIWRNGAPLFHTRAGFPSSQNLQVLVPLVPPLKGTDRLELLVCSLESGPFWGVALSLWDDQSIREVCGWKERLLKTSRSGTWPLEGIHRESCLGPIAGAAVPEELRVGRESEK
jgi:hypothetical protein